MNEIKVDNPNGLPTIDYHELEDLQMDLKTIGREELNKLKNSIIKHGIFLPKFVWENKGKYWTLDGHQTKKALESLSTEYKIPKIPIVKINAKNRQDAVEKLLIINSRYGRYNVGTFLLDEIEIPDFIEIPELGLVTQHLLSDDEFIAEEEWKGMPEYNQDDLKPIRTIYVHFKKQADINNFMKLIKQKITDKTKYIWFPEVKRADNLKKSYINES